MGIQPIDLQMVYSQLEKVSKNVTFQQQGAQLQGAIQQEKAMEQQNQKSQSVQETQFSQAEAGKVREDGHNGNQDMPEQNNDKSKKEEIIEESLPNFEIIRDPTLGTHFDITG